MNTRYMLVGITGFLAAINSSWGQSWTLTSAPSNNWYSIAMSADGAKLAAVVYGGGVYESTNSGDTWTQTTAPSNRWVSVASSTDGSRLIAAHASPDANYLNGRIYISTNFGASWNQVLGLTNSWRSVASSADGSKLVAATGGTINPTPICQSADAGATWTSNYFYSKDWICVASSADANVLLAGRSTQLYISTNPWAAWLPSSLTTKSIVQGVGASADGKTLMAATSGLFISTDSGTTWYTNLAVGRLYFAAACSADGTQMLVGAGRDVLQSSNAGVDWTITDLGTFNRSVASSADGKKLAVAASPGGIWTWNATPSPKLNITCSSNNLALCWTVPSMPFALQQNCDLGTTNWVTTTTTPNLNYTNLQHQVFLSPATNSCHYRLVSTE